MAYPAHRFAVAPMMDWTDRHCRFFHRGLSRHALLYTEMVTPDAVLHGDRRRLLAYSPEEHPLGLQLGGSEPAKLAEAARIAAEFGYDEVNLNVGCPSDRVQSGSFGACLMRMPDLVGECVAAMNATISLPVTVKCRIGVDNQDPGEALDALADAVFAAGASALWVHARKAWLQGLSPKENREVPPLDYSRVHALKNRLPGNFVGINGGIGDLSSVEAQLRHVDGVMMGRAAYRTPALLAGIDPLLAGKSGEIVDLIAAAERMIPYMERALSEGVRMSTIARPMIGLFQGVPGARRWRQILTIDVARSNAGPEVIQHALTAICGSYRAAANGLDNKIPEAA